MLKPSLKVYRKLCVCRHVTSFLIVSISSLCRQMRDSVFPLISRASYSPDNNPPLPQPSSPVNLPSPGLILITAGTRSTISDAEVEVLDKLHCWGSGAGADVSRFEVCNICASLATDLICPQCLAPLSEDHPPVKSLRLRTKNILPQHYYWSFF